MQIYDRESSSTATSATLNHIFFLETCSQSYSATHATTKPVVSAQQSFQMSSFVGKVVLITGASSGIGAATAIHFSKLGARLAIAGRNTANLEKVGENCASVHADSIKPLIVSGDVSNENDIRKLLVLTIEKYGKLDVLINNAGWWGNIFCRSYNKLF